MRLFLKDEPKESLAPNVGKARVKKNTRSKKASQKEQEAFKTAFMEGMDGFESISEGYKYTKPVPGENKGNVTKEEFEAAAKELEKRFKASNLEDLMEAVLVKNIPIRELFGISKKIIECYYAVGYSLYLMGHYQHAAKVFRLICLVDHMYLKAYQGMAGCFQALGDYAGAIGVYMYITRVDRENIASYLFMGECFFKLKKYNNAKCYGRYALELIGKKKRCENFSKRCQALVAKVDYIRANKIKKKLRKNK